LKPPCIVVVQHILPALRVSVAEELIEKHGLKKKETAEIMGLTPAAITQYLNRTRGDSAHKIIKGSNDVMNLVSEIASDLAHGESSINKIVSKLCFACHILQAEGLICDLHKEAMPSLTQIESCICSSYSIIGDQKQVDL
jgi:predicted transcriptional regulator